MRHRGLVARWGAAGALNARAGRFWPSVGHTLPLPQRRGSGGLREGAGVEARGVNVNP